MYASSEAYTVQGIVGCIEKFLQLAKLSLLCPSRLPAADRSSQLCNGVLRSSSITIELRCAAVISERRPHGAAELRHV